MADIKDKITKIRTATYGVEVRGSLADGLEAVNNEQIALDGHVTSEVEAVNSKVDQNNEELNRKVDQNNEELTGKVDKKHAELDKKQTDLAHENEALDKKFDDLIKNSTVDDPSSVEIVAARSSGVTGVHYETLGKRLDHDELAAQTYTDEQIKERIGAVVKSVNGRQGDVILTNKDVDAPTVNDVNTIATGLRSEIDAVATDLKTNYIKLGQRGPNAVATLLNGWYTPNGTIDDEVRYERDPLGFVHISGACTGGKVDQGTMIFQLPLGYRPKRRLKLLATPVPSPKYLAYLWVTSDGRVVIQSSDLPGPWVTLYFDNFIFIAL